MEIPSNEILSLDDYLECGSYDDFFKVSIIDTDAMTFLNRIRLFVSSPRKRPRPKKKYVGFRFPDPT